MKNNLCKIGLFILLLVVSALFLTKFLSNNSVLKNNDEKNNETLLDSLSEKDVFSTGVNLKVVTYSDNTVFAELSTNKFSRNGYFNVNDILSKKLSNSVFIFMETNDKDHIVITVLSKELDYIKTSDDTIIYPELLNTPNEQKINVCVWVTKKDKVISFYAIDKTGNKYHIKKML